MKSASAVVSTNGSVPPSKNRPGRAITSGPIWNRSTLLTAAAVSTMLDDATSPSFGSMKGSESTAVTASAPSSAPDPRNAEGSFRRCATIPSTSDQNAIAAPAMR
jgi:hypothetical protein